MSLPSSLVIARVGHIDRGARFERVYGTLIAEKRLQTLVSEIFRLRSLPRHMRGDEPFPHG